jgi:hypothetical protein
MAVQSIFSPDWFEGGQLGTQFVANPWGTPDAPASPVWIQCTVPWSQVFDTVSSAAFGLIEVDFLDDNGAFQQTQFGDITNLSSVSPGDLPPRLFVPQFLSATFALLNVNAIAAGTVTFFLWG